MINKKQHYILKLIPPRPTFSQDLTEEEAAIMEQHSTFWSRLMSQGNVIVYGPVMDPAGVYGIGIVEADNVEQVREISINDPAARILRFEFYPMRAFTREQ